MPLRREPLGEINDNTRHLCIPKPCVSWSSLCADDSVEGRHIHTDEAAIIWNCLFSKISGLQLESHSSSGMWSVLHGSSVNYPPVSIKTDSYQMKSRPLKWVFKMRLIKDHFLKWHVIFMFNNFVPNRSAKWSMGICQCFIDDYKF